MIEEGTPFYDRYKFDMVKLRAGIEPEELPSEDTAFQIGKMTQDVLEKSGYARYEISNYAKKGYEGRHNIGYWQRREYLGVGLGASSLLEETRYSNLRGLKEYIEASYYIEGRTMYDGHLGRQIRCTSLHEQADGLSRQAQMEEFMFLGLRMTEGIEKGRFYQAFGYSVNFVYQEAIDRLTEQELLVETPVRLYLTERGMDLNNYVVRQFLL